jgi:hypothetical protein
MNNEKIDSIIATLSKGELTLDDALEITKVLEAVKAALPSIENIINYNWSEERNLFEEELTEEDILTFLPDDTDRNDLDKFFVGVKDEDLNMQNHGKILEFTHHTNTEGVKRYHIFRDLVLARDAINFISK